MWCCEENHGLQGRHFFCRKGSTVSAAAMDVHLPPPSFAQPPMLPAAFPKEEEDTCVVYASLEPLQVPEERTLHQEPHRLLEGRQRRRQRDCQSSLECGQFHLGLGP